MVKEGTKKDYAISIAEKAGLNPGNPSYHSKGGTETRELYKDIAESKGVIVPEEANKAKTARLAIESVGGNPQKAVSSRGGTETKATLKEIYDNMD